jgi:hypothetical protein
LLIWASITFLHQECHSYDSETAFRMAWACSSWTSLEFLFVRFALGSLLLLRLLLRLEKNPKSLSPGQTDTQWGYKRSGGRRHWRYVHGTNSVWSTTAEDWSRLVLTKIRNEDTKEVGGESTEDMCTEGTPSGPRAQVWVAISRTGFGPCSNSNDDDPTMRRPHKTLSLSLLDKSLRESSFSVAAATAWRKP